MTLKGSFIAEMVMAAKAGGEVLKRYFGESLETIQKSTAADIKTKADEESEDAILSTLKRDFPQYNILSEETGAIYHDSEYTFVIDPLDGTNNFVLGIPNFSVSIGLLRNKEIIAGVIFNPIIDQTYYAEKGKGAFFDSHRLQVSTETELENASVSVICGYANHFRQAPDIAKSLYELGTKRVLTNWSPTFDFCLLGAGRMNGVINKYSEVYDFAAGKLIAREAGAIITDLDGNLETNDLNQHFIASNGKAIHRQLVEVIRRVAEQSAE